ncbi:sigma-70 family RNA polymerase sigma factor [Planctomycetota bacterium]
MANNTEKFLRLLTPNQGKIYLYILSHWLNRADADDIMQETIAVLWRKFDEFDPDTNFLTWALTVAKYQVMAFSKKTRSRLHLNQSLHEMLEKKALFYARTMDHHLEALEGCVMKLSAHEKRLLEIRYREDHSVRDIAKQMGKSMRVLYKNLACIHEKLLRCVKRTLASA